MEYTFKSINSKFNRLFKSLRKNNIYVTFVNEHSCYVEDWWESALRNFKKKYNHKFESHKDNIIIVPIDSIRGKNIFLQHCLQKDKVNTVYNLLNMYASKKFRWNKTRGKTITLIIQGRGRTYSKYM